MKKTLKEQLNARAKQFARDTAAGSKEVEEAYVSGAEWWSRNSIKPLNDYVKQLKKAHEEAIGPVNFGIMEQIKNTATLMEHRDRLREELALQESYMHWETGSTKQMSQVFDQRASELRKVITNITDELTALGLNYNSTPSKVVQDKKKGIDADKDGLMSRISEVQDTMNDVPTDI